MRRPHTLAARLFLWQLSVVLVVLFGVGFVLDRYLEQDAVNDVTAALEREAQTVQQALPSDDAALQPVVTSLGEASGTRLTVVRTDGEVLADSEHDPATMENHADRPEIRTALGGEVGTSSRDSETVGIPFRYVALPPEGDRIVRVALPLTQVARRRVTARTTIVLGLLTAAILASVGALLVSRGVTRPLRRATESVRRLGQGDLRVRIEPAGPQEFAELAETLNVMAARLEAQIRSSEDDRRTRDLILSSMTEGILLAGPEGAIRFTNAEIERLLGERPRNASSLVPTPLRDAIRGAAERETVHGVEVEVGSPTRWIRGDAIRVDPEGSVLLVLRDVTEARRLDAVRRDFVANASHELKTPAASIRATAETIGTAALEDPAVVPRFAAQLEREAVRLSRIVSDLLDLSRLETGSDLGEEIALDELIRDEAERFEAAAAAADVRLGFDLARVPPVRGSLRDLALMTRNLVDNAIRYTSEGGSVQVALRAGGDDVVLTVTDTGVGIPRRDLGRVFERFYRVDRARSRDTGGTGLGLSIVKHVAENHGGSVRVESELGAGSTFEVRLPAVSP